MGWDTKEFKAKGAKLEKDKHAPKKEQLAALKDYLELSREQHQRIRDQSCKFCVLQKCCQGLAKRRTVMKSKPITEVILENASVSTELSAAQHKVAQEYLGVQLSIRDRDQIVQVLCHSTPDHLTQTVRDVVAAYEPVIRNIHEAVDLSATVGDLEYFLRDMIRLSKAPEKPKSSGLLSRGGPREDKTVPTVGDFVALLKKHQGASHRFVHQCAKNGPEVTSWFYEYAKAAVSNFKRPPDAAKSGSDANSSSSGAGTLTEPLQKLFSSLPAEKRESFLPVLDAHCLFLFKATAASSSRFRTVVSTPASHNPALQTPRGSRASSPAPGGSNSPTSKDQTTLSTSTIKALVEADPGPGAYLARWQNLLDGTVITPASHGGKIRHAGDGSVLKASRIGADAVAAPPMQRTGSTQSRSEETDEEDVFEAAHENLDELGLEEKDKVKRPNVTPIVDALGEGFRKELGRIGCRA